MGIESLKYRLDNGHDSRQAYQISTIVKMLSSNFDCSLQLAGDNLYPYLEIAYHQVWGQERQIVNYLYFVKAFENKRVVYNMTLIGLYTKLLYVRINWRERHHCHPLAYFLLIMDEGRYAPSLCTNRKTNQAVEKVVLKIDIIHYRKSLTDKPQNFTLNTELALITFFWETLSKSYTDFDSYKMYLLDFAH